MTTVSCGKYLDRREVLFRTQPVTPHQIISKLIYIRNLPKLAYFNMQPLALATLDDNSVTVVNVISLVYPANRLPSLKLPLTSSYQAT